MIDKLQISQNDQIDDDSLLAFAKGLLASRQWLDAAGKLEEYSIRKPDDWEASYLRGVAYANARGDRRINLRALRACNDTITFAPMESDPNLRSRLFAYRGAILKRLGRLDEAESDLLLAERDAASYYESHDIYYNLAGVYAIRGDRDRLFEYMDKLHGDHLFINGIRAHLDAYFRKFRNDEEFLRRIHVL